MKKRQPQLLISLLTGVVVAFLLSACASTPASLQRLHAIGFANCRFEQRTIHSLLELAVENPNRGDSAHALAHVVELWRGSKGDAISGKITPDSDSLTDVVFDVQFSETEPGKFAPSYFEEITPAVDFKIKKIKRIQREGYGAPLQAIRENTKRESVEAFYPPEVISREVTAVIFLEEKIGGVQKVRIELLCTLFNDEVTVAGSKQTLAADFSIAYAGLLARSKGINKSEFQDILTPSPTQTPRLFLLQPYDPGKEPLIMIHGLLDSPLVWANLTNELRSDDYIRSRYQIWHFLYNTSAPGLYSGRILREQYRELRNFFDPEQNDPASQRTTLLTHSMGGIVARGLITDPGDAFWDAGFTKPLESLQLSAKDRESLTEAFLWKPEPSVKRVVFMAVPHRGSKFAENPIGKLGRALVKPPSGFADFYRRISESNPGAFTELYKELGSGEMDSVSSLSPEQPTLKMLPDLPIGRGVALHSIIGDRGRKGPVEESSDGVVEYWSSHLEGVDSELIVPSSHGVYRDPEAISEVQRILRLPK